jgi:hypothetical protein
MAQKTILKMSVHKTNVQEFYGINMGCAVHVTDA